MIEVKHASYRKRKKTRMEDISFTINEPSITGLVGANGAGKTTLLNVIAGHLKPTAGESLWEGESIFQSLAASSATYFSHEDLFFPYDHRIRDIFTDLASFYPNFNQDLAYSYCDYFSLSVDAKYYRLSTGQASVARAVFAFAVRTPLLLLDEPTTGMDEKTRVMFHKCLLKEFVEHPRFVLMSTHYIEETENLLDSILLINKGKRVFHHSLEEINKLGLKVSGKTDDVLSFVEPYNTIATETSADFLYTTSYIEHSLSENALWKIEAKGLKIQPMSVKEVCNLYSMKKKGRVEDVFETSNNE
ncbi:ABC transporter, ATP-binding protein [Bacillus sp. JCM 19046]|nr:ABC transporter, ATP-binding protein [Bacillus sp. JCM 19045]GAF19310.1 ABC transporter, ATP-binding protein [Bacillus sp. JCM 19046]